MWLYRGYHEKFFACTPLTNGQNLKSFVSISPNSVLIFSKNFLNFKSDAIEKQDIINLLSYDNIMEKNLKATLLFVDFSKAFDSIHRGKMERILLAHGFSKETVTVMTMLCKDTKAMVQSTDGNINFFDIVTGVLQGDTLASYLFLICLDCIQWRSIDLMKKKGFILKKTRSR